MGLVGAGWISKSNFKPPMPNFTFGGVAQLGEHLPCKQGVSGSIPLISTISIFEPQGLKIYISRLPLLLKGKGVFWPQVL
jgi:hypothetical protein